MKTTKRVGLLVKTALKAGGHNLNHNAPTKRASSGLRVKTSVKAGRIAANHNAAVKCRLA